MNFEACVRYFDSNGIAKVYVRITHNRKVGYVKTRFTATKNQVRGNLITDINLLGYIIPLIQEWSGRLNAVNLSDVNDIISFIKNGDQISFTKYANEFIRKMSADDRHNASINYSTSLRSLQGFLKKDDLLFSDITSFSLNLWIDSLSKTRRAKSMYPNCIKAIYNSGLLEYNDYDNGTIRIKHDPFRIVKIPKMMPGKKKSITPDVIAKIFAYSGVYSKPTLGPLSKDVVTLSFFLAGMNAADLYSMDKSCLKGNKLYYNRKKTSTVRDDNAYMEIEIPDEVLPLLKKYKGKDRVFSFYEMYYDLSSFNKYINKGLKDICGHLGVDDVTTYTFRHSWATIAQNDCGASTELVGFCLNHASAHKITEGYIKKDYSRVDILNRKVINIVKAKMPNFAAGHSLE